MASLVVDSGEEARTAVRSIVPIRTEVFNNTSRTLEAIGVADDIERSGQYQPLRPRLYQMDREMQAREMRRLAQASAYMGGSPEMSVRRPMSRRRQPSLRGMAKVLTHMCMSLDGFVAQPDDNPAELFDWY